MDDNGGEVSAAKKLKHDEASTLNFLKTETQSWSGSNGLVLVAADRSDGSWQHAPVAITPATIQRKLFQEAIALASPFNKLIDRVARDTSYLKETLADSAKGDEFTKRLLELLDLHGGDKARQQLYLGIHRSDYMVDDKTKRLLQVELNTISSSFACLSARVTRLHQHLLCLHPQTQAAVSQLDKRFAEAPSLKDLPKNDADKEIPKALVKAHRLYDQRRKDKKNGRTLYILFVIQEAERNYVDQRHIEYEITQSSGVPCLRRTLAEIAQTGTVDADNGALLIEGGLEISVAYFRAGYTPTDYPTEVQWSGRSLIESSLAIKCPSIAYHLVGAKKVQQRLADPGVLERFVSDKAECAKIRACFAGLWSLGSDLDPTVKAKAMENPGNFVIKPQREGGGNNIYGENVKTALQTMSAEELGAHILMERIFPAREEAYLMRHAEIHRGPALSELGIYSTFVGDGNKSYLDKVAGHLLRTKFDGVDEGGVATGFASLNSPYLVDN